MHILNPDSMFPFPFPDSIPAFSVFPVALKLSERLATAAYLANVLPGTRPSNNSCSHPPLFVQDPHTFFKMIQDYGGNKEETIGPKCACVSVRVHVYNQFTIRRNRAF